MMTRCRYLRGAQSVGNVVATTHHRRHRQRDQLEVDIRSTERNQHHQGGDEKLSRGRGSERVLDLRASGKNALELCDIGVDLGRAVIQTGDVALDLYQGLARGAPERQARAEDLVAPLVRGAVLAQDPLVDVVERIADVGQDALHDTIAGGPDLRERFDCLHPFWSRRRNLAAALVVFLDARNFVHQLALKRRVPLEVALDERRHALQLPLEGKADLTRAMSQEHFTVAHPQPRGGVSKPARAEAQRANQRPASAPEQGMHRLAGEVQEWHRQHQQSEQ